MYARVFLMTSRRSHVVKEVYIWWSEQRFTFWDYDISLPVIRAAIMSTRKSVYYTIVLFYSKNLTRRRSGRRCFFSS